MLLSSTRWALRIYKWAGLVFSSLEVSGHLHQETCSLPWEPDLQMKIGLGIIYPVSATGDSGGDAE